MTNSKFTNEKQRWICRSSMRHILLELFVSSVESNSRQSYTGLPAKHRRSVLSYLYGLGKHVYASASIPVSLSFILSSLFAHTWYVYTYIRGEREISERIFCWDVFPSFNLGVENPCSCLPQILIQHTEMCLGTNSELMWLELKRFPGCQYAQHMISQFHQGIMYDLLT